MLNSQASAAAAVAPERAVAAPGLAHAAAMRGSGNVLAALAAAGIPPEQLMAVDAPPAQAAAVRQYQAVMNNQITEMDNRFRELGGPDM